MIKYNDTTEYTEQLMKLVLIIFFRIVSCVEEGP